MGTNYYWQPPNAAKPCEACGHVAERVHIGKSSAGWCFSLHAIPELGLTSWDAWLEWLSARPWSVQDEYGQDISRERLVEVVTRREWGRDSWQKAPLGYKSWAEFHAMNGSQPGPNGLLRHRADGRHCLAHGDGTWDLIAGEFF